LLLFSSYGHGSDDNGYLEIYNAGMAAADLRHVGLVSRDSQGSLTWHSMARLLQPGGYYLITHPAADSALLDAANETYEHLSVGNTAYAIATGNQSGFSVLDSIGFFGEHSGMFWSVCGDVEITEPATLLRKAEVTIGNAGNWSRSAGSNALDCEWLVFARNDVHKIHTFCPIRPVAASIQDVRTDNELLGEQVHVEGVIAAVITQKLVFLQDPSSIEEHTGLWLRSPSGVVQEGDVVKVSGMVSDYLGLRFLAQPHIVVKSSGEAPRAVLVGVSTAHEELWQYQGMLVRVEDVGVHDVDIENCRFRLGDAAALSEQSELWAELHGPCKINEDQRFASIQGPLHFAQGRYVVLPRNGCDMRLEDEGCLEVEAPPVEAPKTPASEDDADRLSIFVLAIFCGGCAASLGTVLGIRCRMGKPRSAADAELAAPEVFVVGRPVENENVESQVVEGHLPCPSQSVSLGWDAERSLYPGAEHEEG